MDVLYLLNVLFNLCLILFVFFRNIWECEMWLIKLFIFCFDLLSVIWRVFCFFLLIFIMGVDFVVWGIVVVLFVLFVMFDVIVGIYEIRSMFVMFINMISEKLSSDFFMSVFFFVLFCFICCLMFGMCNFLFFNLIIE